MGLRLRLAAATCAALCACSSDPDPIDSFAIVFQLDVEGDAATCNPGLTCASFPMACDSRVAIRVLTPNEETEDPDDLMIHKSFCLDLEWHDEIADICPIGDPEFLQFVRFESVPAKRGQVEVTIWRDSAAVESCPVVPYDVAGRPIPAGELTPAFGRRVYFDFGGQDPVVEVPLACTNPQSLTDLSCEPPEVYDFEVHADDISDPLIAIDEGLAMQLGVRVGQPVPVAGDPDDFEIVTAESIELGLVSGPNPFWKEDDSEIDPSWNFTIGEGRDICAIVTDSATPPAATCTTISAAEAAGEEPVSVDGYMVDFETWETIQDAIGVNVFPTSGLVLGRVVDTGMSPLADVVVISSETPQPLIQYLNEDLTDYRDGGGVPLAKTSTSGYFVATGAAFRSTWDATLSGTWRVVGTPRGGQLNNRTITVVVIQMFEDFK